MLTDFSSVLCVGASLEVCDSLALAEEDGDSSSDDEAAPVWDKTGSVLALDDAVPRQVAAGVFDAVAAAAKQFEATRGEAARVVLEPTAYTMTKPGRVTDYTAGATCKVVYQLHGPMNVKYGKTADGRASVTAKVLQRAVSHAAVRFDGVVVAELVPVVWDDWFDEELTEMLLGVGGAEGVYAPVARTAIRAAFGSGALVVVAFGDHVQQRCSEVAAVVGGRTEIVEGVVHYVASVDGGRSVDVVECVHPSAPGALASVTVAVALAQLITDGKAWVQELPALVALFTRMEAITKPAKHLAAWVLAELSRDQLRAIISGLRRADGDQTGVDTHGKGGGVVWTASVVTRDEYQRLFLLAGYSSYFNVKYLKGSTHGAGVHGDEFKANHTLWAVHFANDTTRFAQPSVQRDRDLRQVAFAGRVWCVNVPHKDHLIFVRRVLQVGEKGEVVAASPPIITGNSNIFNYKYSMFVEIPAICKDDLVALEPKLCSMLGGVSQLLLCTRITAGLHLLDPVSLKLVEVSAGTFFHHRFRSQVSAKQLQEYVILDIEKIDSARKEADHPNALDMRSFNKQKLVMNQKMCLAVATVARVSDMGKNDTTFEIKTHLGHMLNPGDTALGYDLTKANWNDDVKISKKHGLPAVCLVRKSYPKRNRAGRRAFALKHLPKEESEAPPKKMDLLRSEQEMEEFLNEIEEDPEMQGKVNLYRKQGQGVVASARGEAAAASSSSMSDSDMGTGAGGDHVDGDEGAADEEFPQIDMDALLDDLGAVTIGAFDDQAGKEVDTDNEAVEMDGPPQSSAASSHGGPTQAKGRNNVKGRK
jgi:hypothetical protein